MLLIITPQTQSKEEGDEKSPKNCWFSTYSEMLSSAKDLDLVQRQRRNLSVISVVPRWVFLRQVQRSSGEREKERKDGD